MKNKQIIMGWAILTAMFITACRDIETTLPPQIIMEKTDFSIKSDRNLLIEPIVENAGDYTVYSWKLNGKVIGTEKRLTFKEKETGTYFVTFKVTTPDGNAQKEIRIDVLDLDLPIIGMEGGNDIMLETGEKYIFKPEIANKEGLKLHWIMDNKEVSQADEYSFVSNEEGLYFINLKAENEDGEDEYLIKILVVKEAPLNITFPYPEQSASLARTIRVVPTMPSTKNNPFTWFVTGKEDKTQTTDKFVYTPSALGKTNVKVVATKGEKKGEASIVVNTIAPEKYFRPITASSRPYSTKVYEVLPAPGQFVNQRYTAHTMEEADALGKMLMQVVYDMQ